MSKYIVIHPYDPKWPLQYKIEAEHIRNCLQDHFIEIHHIGSTSVPGLYAKEDIDILCVVDSLKNSLKLEELGYLFRGELNIPLRYFYSKNSNASRVNLHVVEEGHGFIGLNLAFRDYLRDTPEACRNYSELKINLSKDPKAAEKIQGMPKYTLDKNEFIKSILNQIGFQGYNLYFCLHYKEWETYHHLHEELLYKPKGLDYDPKSQNIGKANHYHFVLYKGTEIVAAAHIELRDQKAILLSVASNKHGKPQDLNEKILLKIKQWLEVKSIKEFII